MLCAVPAPVGRESRILKQRQVSPRRSKMLPEALASFDIGGCLWSSVASRQSLPRYLAPESMAAPVCLYSATNHQLPRTKNEERRTNNQEPSTNKLYHEKRMVKKCGTKPPSC